jgi:hypothetical protein
MQQSPSSIEKLGAQITSMLKIVADNGKEMTSEGLPPLTITIGLGENLIQVKFASPTELACLGQILKETSEVCATMQTVYEAQLRMQINRIPAVKAWYNQERMSRLLLEQEEMKDHIDLHGAFLKATAAVEEYEQPGNPFEAVKKDIITRRQTRFDTLRTATQHNQRSQSAASRPAGIDQEVSPDKVRLGFHSWNPMFRCYWTPAEWDQFDQFNRERYGESYRPPTRPTRPPPLPTKMTVEASSSKSTTAPAQDPPKDDTKWAKIAPLPTKGKGKGVQ